MATTFKARFDGKVLIPQDPLDLPPETELLLEVVPVDKPLWADPLSRDEVARQTREYYERGGGEDEEDRQWAEAVSKDLGKVWNEMDKE